MTASTVLSEISLVKANLVINWIISLMFCTVVMYCTVILYCTVLSGAVLYCIALYYQVLYCIVLYCIVLYCTIRWAPGRQDTFLVSHTSGQLYTYQVYSIYIHLSGIQYYTYTYQVYSTIHAPILHRSSNTYLVYMTCLLLSSIVHFSPRLSSSVAPCLLNTNNRRWPDNIVLYWFTQLAFIEVLDM